MAPTLPDEADAWVDRLQRELNRREEFAEAAAGFDAAFRFLILPDDAYPGDPVPITVVVADGACVAAEGNDPDADYDFELRGPYGAWRDLLEDEIDVTSAVMGGPFDLAGSTMKLMQRRDAVSELIDAAQSVDAEFGY